MHSVPIQVLKQQLATCIARVEAGERLTITRRNRPVAELGPPAASGLHVGARFGHGRLVPLPLDLPGDALARVLAEDRNDDR